jgi:Putative zinc-finger/Anti-sigma-K factor rskA
MKPEQCRQWRERIGALVLGQLTEDERFAVEAHLEGCPACRAEAEALAPVVPMLRRADPARLEPAPEPPAELGERIARRIAAERRSERRRRRRARFGLATAGAAAAAAVAALLIVILGGSSPSSRSETVAFRSLPQGAWAKASLAPHPWGSEISVQVGGFHRGTMCQVWLRRKDGKRVSAGSFRYVYQGGSEHAGLSSAVTLDRATAIGLRVGSRTFVAPLPSGSSGVGASWSPTTRQEEDT